MKKIFFASLFIYIYASAQNDTIAPFTPPPQNLHHTQIYRLNPSIDIPITAVGTAWSLYCFTKIYDKGESIPEQILALDRNDVNSFDRGGMYPYSQTIDAQSDVFFLGSMPYPFLVFLLSENTRSDFWKLSFIYWETMAVMGYLGPTATYAVDKHRPYAYFSETPMEKRLSQNGKNSFYAGHVQTVAGATFCAAKIYNDYYPHSNTRWAFWGVATVATLSTGWLRLRGGQHFYSDTILGITTGTLAGILVPHFHTTKDRSLGVLPYINGDAKGLSLLYRFQTESKGRYVSIAD